jgi:hypothetical protein
MTKKAPGAQGSFYLLTSSSHPFNLSRMLLKRYILKGVFLIIRCRADMRGR